MSNPTGTTFLQANGAYVWTDGDIYLIPQTDQVEGAASGASFSGIGVENQPHQVLLNKIQYTHAHQVADEINIANLLTFKGLFTGTVGQTGFMKLGIQDSAKGQIDVIVQWGNISTVGLPTNQSGEQSFTFNFPIAFPNQIWVILPTVWGPDSALLVACNVSTNNGLKKQTNTITLRTLSAAGTDLVFSSNGLNGIGVAGIQWIALGY